MVENKPPTLDELRPLVADISRNVLDQIAPEESQMLGLFMDAYYKPIAPPSNGGMSTQDKDMPLGFGTPDLMASLVIPLVLAILIELAKEGIIPIVKEWRAKKASTETTFDIEEKRQKAGNITEIIIKVRVKDRRLAKKIIVAVNRVIASNL